MWLKPCVLGVQLNIQGWNDWETSSHIRASLLGSIVQQVHWLLPKPVSLDSDPRPCLQWRLMMAVTMVPWWHTGLGIASTLYSDQSPVCPRITGASPGCEIVSRRDLCRCSVWSAVPQLAISICINITLIVRISLPSYNWADLNRQVWLWVHRPNLNQSPLLHDSMCLFGL